MGLPFCAFVNVCVCMCVSIYFVCSYAYSFAHSLSLSLQLECKIWNHVNFECLWCVYYNFQAFATSNAILGWLYVFKCHLSRFGFVKVCTTPLLLYSTGYTVHSLTRIKYTKFMNTNVRSFTLEKHFRAHCENWVEKTESIYWLDVFVVVVVVVVVFVADALQPTSDARAWKRVFLLGSSIACLLACLLAIFIVFDAYEFVNICVMLLFMILYRNQA